MDPQIKAKSPKVTFFRAKRVAASIPKACSFCHQIYTRQKDGRLVYSQKKETRCLECDSDYVPELIIASIEPPQGINIIGAPKLIEERVCIPKTTTLRGEALAVHVSESVFFAEYHLHSQLVNKMKFMGKNSIFALRMQIQVSEENIVGIATGTAMTLKALPIPQPIDIKVDKYF